MHKFYFENTGIIYFIEHLIECVQCQNYAEATGGMQYLMNRLKESCSVIIQEKAYFWQGGLEVVGEYIVTILEGLLSAQENEDYILVVDLLKLQIVPLLLDVQNAIRTIEGFFEYPYLQEENLKKLQERNEELYQLLLQHETIHQNSEYKNSSYFVEPTTVGNFTLRVVDGEKERYFHSNDNPIKEAKAFADYYYDINQEKYVIIGLGLGYHVAKLLEKDKEINIVVYESDIEIILQAFRYTNMDWYFQHNHIQIYFDPEFKRLGAELALGKNMELIVHRPSLLHIQNEAIKRKLEQYFVHDNGRRKYEQAFYKNSKSNFAHCDAYVDELEEKFKGKQVIIVGAGPSLEKNIHLLKNKPENVVILAMGAVMKRLLQENIAIDYVIIIDPKPVTINQIAGYEQENIPLLLMSTAVKEIGRRYQGKKYLICQNGYDRAEEYAEKRGYHTYNTGGSVATVALDICIYFQAESIVFTGLDLAFTGNRDHIVGARQDGKMDYEGMLQVPAIGGGMVYTSVPFNMHREWLEHRIQEKDAIMPIYDASEGGAWKKGMITTTLKDIFSKNKDR